ncbi:RIIa domain-containing protein 1 [Lethenteron reissneri]|uniref:RIIa domain-containing protein 1 n=1 Tax=Lethenteron reissneri TaxID=7753 RepID=UPI002AB7F00F|nr:RIIa domain-containing protein 1 [Lethenteron reissneri]
MAEMPPPPLPPVRGMEARDGGALSERQQRQLETLKVRTRIEDERYLRSHSEIRILLMAFLKEVFLKKPEDVREFAAEFFNDPSLPAHIRDVGEKKERL